MNEQTFLYGFFAIAINTIILQIAMPVFHIQAESGGLLKLVLQLPFLKSLSFLHSKIFSVLFHFMVGFSMVWLYHILFAKRACTKPFIKGILFSFIPWLLNSAIVLPLLHQGFAGHQIISVAGMMYFFIANLLFGLMLGIFIRT
ncbi:hypothetical protein A9P82_08225 [Arachidicoccus ginsenosidimutans]|uniref:hypothetical protein n=1 Tax=Arachidicoccus sp. BS20 TaxID=1850526 RepID=UPI0007F14A96|nr:hypothetical protein [Arachidicoccus sp. BS20]ANI89276.1 hypothetical protein A9P82_08225 [Arachidicoccus sp. BS20]